MLQPTFVVACFVLSLSHDVSCVPAPQLRVIDPQNPEEVDELIAALTGRRPSSRAAVKEMIEDMPGKGPEGKTSFCRNSCLVQDWTGLRKECASVNGSSIVPEHKKRKEEQERLTFIVAP